jgi:hypothetical protein
MYGVLINEKLYFSHLTVDGDMQVVFGRLDVVKGILLPLNLGGSRQCIREGAKYIEVLFLSDEGLVNLDEMLMGVEGHIAEVYQFGWEGRFVLFAGVPSDDRAEEGEGIVRGVLLE